MTVLEYCQYYDQDITPEIADYILMNETAFGFADMATVARQIRSAIRASKNNVDRCLLCGNKRPYHSKGCIVKN